MTDPRSPGTELSSRDDVLLERLLDDVRHATLSLAVSLKACKRSSDNMVLRLSAEQQFESALSQVAPLLGLASVVHDDEVARRTDQTLTPFLALVPQLHWMPWSARLTTIFQDAANLAFGEQALKVDGRPCATFEALLLTRAILPVVVERPPPADASSMPAAPLTRGVTELVTHREASKPVVLFEAVFTQGEGQASHDALVGRMYMAFVVHVRGFTEEAARRALSPAALLGFAASLDKALVGYEGVVAFRIVRKDGKCDAQLLRLAGRPPEPTP